MRTIRTKRADRTIFEVDDEVRLSIEGERAKMQGRASTILGRVVGVSSSGQLVKVKRHGQATPSFYAVAFWEIVDACERCHGTGRGNPGNENRIIWGPHCRCMDPKHHAGGSNKIRTVCDKCKADDVKGLPW